MLEPLEILVAVAFMSVGATVQASTGLGAALIAGPALIAIDPSYLPGPTIVATLILTTRHLLMDGRHADRATVTRAYLGVPIGLALGLTILAVADETAMRTVIGSVIVVAAALLLLGVQLEWSARSDVVGGGAYALSLIAAGIPGPAAAVAFNDLPPSNYRGTIGFLGVPVGVASVALLAVAGEYGAHELRLTVWLLPGIAIGLLAGRHVRPFVDTAWFRPAVLWLALIGGAVVVLREVL